MTLPDTRDPGKTLRTSDNASDPAVSWKVKCLNCGAALAGPFCAECGQRALPPHPAVRELVKDALSEFSGWDGKLAETIRLLVRRPGELTRQWLEGRRVHFISPLRLYLTASLLYFVVAAAAPNLRPKAGTTISVAGIDIGTDPGGGGGGAPMSRPQRVAANAQQGIQSGKALSQQQRDSTLKDIAKAPWLLRPLLTKAVSDPTAIRSEILTWMPRMLFALIPVYAGILALFYRRRNYPEHLYFAIHLHSFVFLALTVAQAAKFTHVVPLSAVVSFAAVSWIIAYAVMALRRVYGGSIGGAVAKGTGIMMLYSLIGIPMLILVVFLSAF
jgi:Protein of unknown function (DUF3667)